MLDALAEARMSSHAVSSLASIDVKADEPAILQLAQDEGWDLSFYSADQLASVSGEFSHSDFVERTVGVGNVCERAAVKAGGTLLMGKTVFEGMTFALAGEETV